MAYGIDRWIFPITITSGVNDTIILDEAGSDYTVTIPEGTYWAYQAAGGGFELPGYPSLYLEISEQLTAAVGGGNAYSFLAANPSGTSLTDNRSIILTRSAFSTNDFSLRFSQPGFTLDKRLFGVSADYAVDLANSGDETPAQGQTFGQWVSPRAASMKVSFPYRKVVLSTEDTARSDLYAMRWTARRRRVFVYRHIPAAWVHQSRAEQLDYAEVVGISQNDTRMAFEHTWEALSTFQDVIVIHDQGDDSDNINNFEDVRANHEIVRLLHSEAASDFENVLTLENMGGEFYQIEVPVIRIGGDYEQ